MCRVKPAYNSDQRQSCCGEARVKKNRPNDLQVLHKLQMHVTWPLALSEYRTCRVAGSSMEVRQEDGTCKISGAHHANTQTNINVKTGTQRSSSFCTGRNFLAGSRNRAADLHGT